MNRRTITAGAILALTMSGATTLAAADATPGHPAAKAAAYSVSLKVNKAEPLQGSRVKLKGTVKPAAPGSVVTLQLRYADQHKWKSIDTAKLSPSSRFSFKDKVSTVRERKYRVVKKADPGHAAGQSPTVDVTVFGWRTLTSLSPATTSSMYEVASTNINGVAYPDSIRSASPYPGYPAPSIEYNLNRGCKAFQATVGLDDSSPASGAASVLISTDTTPRFAGNFTLTQGAPVTFDVTKVFRISFSVSPSNGGLAAVGTPQVLCSF